MSSDLVIDDLLCYLSTARSTISRDNLINNAFSFYEAGPIKASKATISKIAKERIVVRRQCAEHPDPLKADLNDIITCFDKIEANDIISPKFVAQGFNAFPPAGFEYIAPVIASLRNEICALRTEVSEVRKVNERDSRAVNNTEAVAQEVNEVKALVIRVLSKMDEPAPVISTNDAPVSQPVVETADQIPPSSSRNMANEDRHENEWTTVRRRPYSNALRRKSGPNMRNSHNAPSASRPVASASSTQPRTEGARSGHRRRNVIYGTKTNESSLMSGDRIAEIYVGGCNTDTTTDKITQYCAQNGVTVRKCEALNQTTEWTKSFKVSIPSDVRTKMLEAEFWPRGVFVRQFYKARSRNIDS